MYILKARLYILRLYIYSVHTHTHKDSTMKVGQTRKYKFYTKRICCTAV